MEYEANKGKVLTTIFLVSEILFLVLYILLLINTNLLFTLQNYKFITPLIFSLLFSILLKLKIKDILIFNFGVIVINLLLFLFQKLVYFTYQSF